MKLFQRLGELIPLLLAILLFCTLVFGTWGWLFFFVVVSLIGYFFIVSLLKGKFRLLWYYWLGLLTLSTVVFWLSVSNRNIVLLLACSSDNYWSFFTGIFVHASEVHLFSNLFGILFFMYFFAQIYRNAPPERCERQSRLIVAVTLAGAVVVNVAAASVSGISGGLSGAVFILMGMLFAESMGNVMVDLWLKTVKTYSFANNVAIIIYFLFALFVFANSFFNVAVGVNFYAHQYGFLLGFLVNLLVFLSTILTTKKQKD